MIHMAPAGPGSTRILSAGAVRIAWTVGLALIGGRAVVPARADEAPQSTLRILDPDRAAARPARMHVRVNSSSRPAPAWTAPLSTGNRADRPEWAQTTEVSLQPGDVPSVLGGETPLSGSSNSVRTAAGSTRRVTPCNALRGGREDRDPGVRRIGRGTTRVDSPDGHDDVQSEGALRVASYDHQPPQREAEPRAQASLAMPRLLPAASAGAGLEAVFSPPATIPSAYTQVRRIRVATPIAELPVDATPEIDCKAGVDPSGPLEVIDQVDELTVLLRPGKSLRTNVDVCRTGVADPGVCDVVLSTPREISIIGKRPGTTPVTLWPSEGQHGPVTYLVQVGPDAETRQRRDGRYEALEHVLAELFPQSNIRLTPLANRLTVRRQVRDVGRASQIVAVVQDEAVIRRVSTDHPAPEPTDTASFRQTRLENRPPTSTAAPSGHGRFAPTGPANRR